MAAVLPGRRKPNAATSDQPPKAPMVDRRARLLAVATRRFSEFGFEATTVRQIADDVNILSGSLYHHFATKDDMLHEIVRDPVMQMRDNIIRVANAPIDAEQRLVALILLDLGELTRNQAVHAILFNERKFFRSRPEFAYVVQAKKDAYLAWEKVLQDGIDANLFKPDIDMYLTISTIVKMLNMAADGYKNDDVPALDKSGQNALERYIDFYVAFIVNAVRLPARSAHLIPREACSDLAQFRT